MAGTVVFIEGASNDGGNPGATVAKVIDGSTITGWISSASVALNTDIFLTGASSVSDKVSGATVTGYALGAGLVGEPWNFSSGGGDQGNHIFMIANVQGTADTLANGGFGIIAADDLATDSFGTWYVGPQTGSLGGWEYFVINPAAAFDVVTAGSGAWTTGGNPAQLAGVDGVGVRWKVTNTIMGASDNAFVQSMSIGVGYRITGTNAVFSEISTYEVTNRFGALQTKSGTLFPLCKIRIGQASGAAGNVTFSDTGFNVTWQGQVLTSGAKATADGFYGLFADKGSGTTDITFNGGSLTAASPEFFDLELAGVTSVTITNLSVDRARIVTLDSAVDWDGGTVKNSGQITATDAIFTNINVLTSAVAADTAALLWNSSSDPDGNIDGCTFSKGTNAHHAIELGASSAVTVTLRGLTFTGFNASDAQNDSVLLLADQGSNKNWTINAVGCSGTVSFKKVRSGDTVSIVVDPVSLSIHVQDIDTAAAIVGARVYIPVTSSAGGRPFNQTINSITRSGSTATVTFAAAHNLATNDYLKISGCDQNEYNHAFQVTVTGSTTLEVTVTGTPASGSGTMVGTWIIINGVTDGSGNISASYTYASNQPISGAVRFASGAGPYYKTAPISGTVSSSTGLSVTVQMILDS